ncbi:hypothetical protein JHK87_039479 [Glycine soja]|nr:hypothetical protein JHK87_039479 [Glycine soja]
MSNSTQAVLEKESLVEGKEHPNLPLYRVAATVHRHAVNPHCPSLHRHCPVSDNLTAVLSLRFVFVLYNRNDRVVGIGVNSDDVAENQTRWRKRKRDSQISRRHQKHEEEEEEEDDDDDDENPNGATRSTIRRTKRTTTTVIRNLTWRRRSSPTTAFRCRSSR